MPGHDAQNIRCHALISSGIRVPSFPAQQLFRHRPGVSAPSMKSGFAEHSPASAHPAQFSSTSSQRGSLHTPVSNLRSWIHFVAVHFTPPTVGQLACVLARSDPPCLLKLKKRTASPRYGLTDSPRPSRHAQSLSWSFIPRSRCATAGNG